MSLTFTQEDLDNLKEALVTGAQKVKIGDREVEYRSQKDLIDAINMIESILSPGDVEDVSGIVRPTFSKGEKS